MTTKANRIIRYYDTHELEGAELTESRLHREIISYLTLVINWIFNARNIGVTGNTNFYQTSNPKEPPKSPDIAVVEGLEMDPDSLEDTSSYYVGEDGPPPLVVFEIASEATWRADLEDKPARYEAMGVQEYFVFDPNTRTLWTGQWRGYKRLVGWRRNDATGRFEMLERDPDGRLWSKELDSWLVIERTKLRLYTADGQLRLTEAEAEALLREVEVQRADKEARRADTETRRADTEARLRKAEAQRADREASLREAEAQLREAATLKAQRLAEKLRELGIDPEE